MRGRSLWISSLLAVTSVAVYDTCRPESGTEGAVSTLLRFTIAGFVAMGFWAGISTLDQYRDARQHARRPIKPRSLSPLKPLRLTGPGKFKVVGTDMETHFDTTEFVYADSPDHAAVKVGLKGVDVKSVEPVGQAGPQQDPGLQ